MTTSAGRKFRDAVATERPLQLPGVINAYIALMAEDCGFKALYLSGAGVANMSYGLPDLGMTTLDNVLEDVRRITAVTRLPLLVDADTGWGDEHMIARVVQEMTRAGAAGIHLEDQAYPKRCGHRPGKQLVSTDEMSARVKAAVEAKTDPHFVVMARSDALATEGVEGALYRAQSYQDAGADMLFLEAATSLDDYRIFREKLNIPILANLTEFGKTPLVTTTELKEAGVDIALYPLSAARAMNQAALEVLSIIRIEGTQVQALEKMQTRDALYEVLNYHAYEQRLDQGAEQK